MIWHVLSDHLESRHLFLTAASRCGEIPEHISRHRVGSICSFLHTSNSTLCISTPFFHSIEVFKCIQDGAARNGCICLDDHTASVGNTALVQGVHVNVHVHGVWS